MTDGVDGARAQGPVTPATQLGPDWVTGEDGLPFRRGARVILLDAQDRVLMVRGHDMDEPDRSWWFTVGGGIDDGETPHEAAVRELAEETGLRLAVGDLTGPVADRTAVFDFLRQSVRQDEVFFLARIADPAPLTAAGWTDVERGFMDEMRWWPLDELAAVDVEVFPEGLVDLVRGLVAGWDGRLRHLRPQSTARRRP